MATKTRKKSPPSGSAKKTSSKKTRVAKVTEKPSEEVDEDDESQDDDPEVIVASGEGVDEESSFGSEFSEPAEDSFDNSRRESTAALTVRDKSSSLAAQDPLQAYMREVQAHPLLTPEEEKELAVKYTETQDVDAAARLVTANLRLVVKLAYEYRRAYRNMMDLVQEGNMGLMQAVKKYDPYRGVKLSSYAAWWIRAYMLRYILANWRMVKLGTTQAQRKLFFNLNKEKAKLSAMGIEPTHEEIAKRLDVTEKEVSEMDKRMARSDASLDTPVNESEGHQVARVELLPAPGDQPDVVTESAELGQLLREHLTEFRKDLEGKDLIIFDERLVADDPRTLQDLGDQFGVSRERVRQLEARMTKKLRVYLSERIGNPISVEG